MIAPVPVTQPWKTLVNGIRESTKDWQHSHGKTKHTVHIFYGIYSMGSLGAQLADMNAWTINYIGIFRGV